MNNKDFNKIVNLAQLGCELTEPGADHVNRLNKLLVEINLHPAVELIHDVQIVDLMLRVRTTSAGAPVTAWIEYGDAGTFEFDIS